MSENEESTPPERADRAVSEIVGVLVMILLTLSIVGVVGTFVLWGP